MDKTARHRTLGTRLIRIFLKSVLFLLLFILLIYLFILTPPGQHFLKKKFVAYLENRLDTKVTIGKIYVDLPKKIVLEDLYLEDRSKDTLIAAGELKLDLAILKLAFRNEVYINNIELSKSVVKIRRPSIAAGFNYQFIVDAFTPTPDSTRMPDTTTSVLEIKRIALNKVRADLKDAVSGSDASIYLEEFDTRLGKLDPDNLVFEIPSSRLEGVVAHFYQSKPITNPESEAKDIQESAEPTPLQLDFDKIDLSDIQFDYRNDVSAAYAKVNLDELNLRMNELDLRSRIMNIQSLNLENSKVSLRLGKKETAKVLVEEAEKEISTRMEAGWRLIVEELTLNNNDLQFDNDNEPIANRGMDYAHLQADSLRLAVSDLLLSNDSIGGKILSASFREKSGFVLEQLQTEFLYSPTTSSLTDLYLKTPGTELRRKASIRYRSIESLQYDIGNMYMEADIENSRVRVSDILTFVPTLKTSPAFSNPNATVFINTQLRGTLDAIQIDLLQVKGLHETDIDLKGNISGLLTGKRPVANLTIRELTTSQRDVAYFVPPGIIPTNITLPQQISLNGDVVTKGEGLQTQLNIVSSMGHARVNGQLVNWASRDNIQYRGAVAVSSFDAGTLLKNNQIPNDISANFTINGRGTDTRTMNVMIDGTIESIVYNNYNYKNILLRADLSNQRINSTLRVHDPNIDISADWKANISLENPNLFATVMVDSIKLQPLNFSPDPVIYRGKLEADFPVADLKAPEGNLLVSQSLVVNGEKRVQLDTIQVVAGRSDTGRFVNVSSPLVNGSLRGQYNLLELPNVVAASVQPYFSIPQLNLSKPQSPYDFKIDINITNNKAWSTIYPSLTRMQPASVNGHFSNSGWSATASAPLIERGKQQIRGLQADIKTQNDSLVVNATVDHLFINENFQLNSTTVAANAANNQVAFALNSRDRVQQTKYNFEGSVQYSQGQYVFSLHPGNLLLNYDTWNITADNQVITDGKNIRISNFVLSRNSQQLSIQSLGNQPNSPLQAKFSNFQLLTITGLIQADSTLADGRLNGTFTLEQINPRPIFTADLIVNNLRIKNDTTGNLRLQVNNRTAGTYDVNATLEGRGNDMVIDGTYQPFAAADPLNLTLDIQNLNVSTVQALSAGNIYNGSGSLKGKFKVNGSIAKPTINGNLSFDKAVFAIKNLGDHFEINNEQIHISEKGLNLDNLIIRDSAGNVMRLNGTVATSDFTHYEYDLTVRADNFRLLSTTKAQNKDLYGTLYINANLSIRGDETLPVIDGRLMVNEKTNLTMVLPQKEPSIVRREGIVEFVSFNSPNDSLFLIEDSNYVEFFTGIDASVIIETSKDANFTIIIDEGNGDFINIRGTTLLTAGSDRSGNITLSGTFELESGAYEISFNLLRRRFDIQRGSRITWEGEPTQATVDVTAKYIANVPPLDLVKNQLSESTTSQRNTYMQRLPFEVVLHMEGKLMEPVFSFDISLPDDKSYGVSQDIITTVQTRLEQLRQDEGDRNKQVFSLLLLNRFVADNPFSGSTSTFDAERFARTSVSKLLTEQLNRLAADLIAGVELHFDVQSYEDYSTGDKNNRTDLNVGLSKRLLNDRLTVTVGSNFAIEGTNNTQQANNLIGDVALDYKISRDGRYMVRTYRKNEYYGVLEGYVVETGVGFVVTLDYNRFREIFESSKRKEERQKRRAQNRQQ